MRWLRLRSPSSSSSSSSSSWSWSWPRRTSPSPSPSPCHAPPHSLLLSANNLNLSLSRSLLLLFRSYSPKSESESESESAVTRRWLAQLWQHDTQHPKPTQNANRLQQQPTRPSLQPLLSRPNLVIARDIEWANVLFAFEQESRYLIMDASAPHSRPLAHIREASNLLFRQLLRTRRPFVAHITDSHGNQIFRVRRPFWLINSTIYAEVDGKEIGVVHRRWHLWRRIYDLYLGNKQFAVVENPGFWNWTFTLKDEEDNVLAQIDRNWRGIGLELFTDAGQYVIRFGGSADGCYDGSDYDTEKIDAARPLTLPERAVALALAVSLDCDYFSRRGGWGLPIMVLEE